MQKYYGANRFVEAAIKAFDQGKPFNPAGCRGFANLFTYDENIVGEYHGRKSTLGNAIRAMNAQEFIASVNEALEQGRNVDHLTARSVGFQMFVAIKGDNRVVSEEAKTQVQAEAKQEGEGVPSTLPQDSTVSVETAENDSQPVLPAEEHKAEVESMDASAPVQSEAQQSDTPDWDYAESLRSSEKPKADLEAYAKQFGVELDRRKSFDSMMVYFRANV
jgi:hypothetical protein